MLSLHSASPRPRSHGRIGLAIAGGGPIGGMYGLGALRALDEALDGLDLTRLDCYVGVSSGAFLTAGLANRISSAEICRIFVTGNSDDARFRPEDFLRPNVYEYLRRAATLPKLAYGWWHDLLTEPRKTRWSDLITRFGGLVPSGLFDNAGVERFMQDVFSRRGRSNDFRALDTDLFVVAVDLDSGRTVRFGEPGMDQVPISLAVQASAALPGLYPPVEIDGRHYVDGALRRTMHASTLLERGIDLMIGINPLVPYDATHAPRCNGQIDRARLLSGGLPAVLSQTFRTLLQSRMQVGLEKYAQQYPRVDQLVFEPNADNSELFFTNLFSYSARHRVCQLAYRNTLADLRRNAEVLEPMLAAHGIALRHEILNDRQRTFTDGVDVQQGRTTEATARLRRALDDVDQVISRRRASRRTRRAPPLSTD
ncbi:patatin-like phospholipase family protein [Xanthomonas translucens]|uniref:patatin-like phospholipase family protein n=1 Tax=Xanthomonas campestris pv. translucens TaxID=343 RepID=UPI00056F6186|nr:patatin-like phospholipase family protein [Xanthomonas translucens]AKK68016.1 lectin subunit beta [Xanthomonas translucens pv. undulosa]AVY66486.1 lectin subunit beta [Xanthomonas translucens pv. undulosa]MBC3972941.1 patatin-like phospholipase family protein [Xanthomonas translucens pv. undulosa]MCT8271919.1 patatin-like phospholipase family protein [Xanthomonas translucens pv. undulosa]MCT8283548.1 patatin-like phospholipase family protein [Xanthomonas translucens pv. undulosa]